MTMVMVSQDRDRTETNTHDSHWKTKMFHHGKELCFFLAVTLTCYAALHSPPPRVSNVPTPVPFLRPSTVVDDFYTGELKTVLKKMMLSEMSFIMYYAPWDAESQRVRWHFEAAARYYHKEIYFAAINCWHPDGKCRKKKRIYKFPLLILTSQGSLGQQYHGVREVSHIISFLKNALRPLSIVHNQTDLAYKATEYDVVVLCNLNFLGFKEKASAAYDAYYSAAQKVSGYQLYDIAFTVALDPDGREFGEVHGAAAMHLFLWNETSTLMTPPELWTADTITEWLVKSIQQATAWVQPPGFKSFTLSPYFSRPVLVLFTPRNPLLRHVYYYNLLREVALSFHNCNDSAWANKWADALQFVRPRIQHYYQKLLQSCASWARDVNERAGVTQVFSIKFDKSESGLVRGNLTNTCTQEDKKNLVPPRSGFDYGYCGLLDYATDIPSNEEPMFRRFFSFLGLMQKKNPLSKCDFRNLQATNPAMFDGLTSQLTGIGDPLSAEKLQEWARLEKCRQLRHARLLDKPFFPNEEELDEGHPGIKGLRCQSSRNKTLSFLAFDSLQLHHFAEKLGVDVLHRKDKSAVLILDPESETQHLLQGEINKLSLTNFIRDYALNKLPRWYRSSNVERRSLDFSLGPTQTIHLSRYNLLDPSECKENVFCVKEITYSNFKSEVLNSRKNVILMYYTPYCAFCNAVSHVFLTVAHTLRPVSTLTFARIDGDNNDLPWEFTVHRFPSIIFFPAIRKGDSHIFPVATEITVTTLVQFVLSNLSPEERIWSLLVICHKGAKSRPLSFQDQNNVEKCVTQVKIEVLQSASHLVNKYRSLLMNFGENESHQTRKQMRKILRSGIVARLRFFRHAMSVLTSFSPLEQNRLTTLTKILKHIKESFYQLKDVQDHLASERTIATEEILKLNVDLNDVKQKLQRLNDSIEKRQSELNAHTSKAKDEL